MMKKTLLIIALTTLTTALTACNFRTNNSQPQETEKLTEEELNFQVHPIIKNIFYELPLHKSRLALRDVIINDSRFLLTDTNFNNFKPSTFFKGISTDNGLIKSKPDSIQVMLIYGNASLVTTKGGQVDPSKHPMILDCRYFFSNKESAEKEYVRLLNMVNPIFSDTSSIMDDKWETSYTIGKQNGTQICNGKIFDNYGPYYRLAISTISLIPSDGSQSYYVLELAFSKEDK